VERELTRDPGVPQMPVLFLVGCPRSGTTAFMQFLQASGAFAVPTNVLSRFYYAPVLGAKIQQLLFDPAFDFRGELTGATGVPPTVSCLGKTNGPLAVSEIGHLWRRFLPAYDFGYIEPERQAEIDTIGLAAEFAGMERVFGRPLALKGGLLYNLSHLRRCAPKTLVVYLKRNRLEVACSILLAREEHNVNRDDWWSVRPREYQWLRTLDVHHQVAGQVFFTHRSLERELALVPAPEWMQVDYGEFCADPAAIYSQIAERFRGLGATLPADYPGPGEFRGGGGRRRLLDRADVVALESALEDFASGRLCSVE